jgi:hypothetical protein
VEQEQVARIRLRKASEEGGFTATEMAKEAWYQAADAIDKFPVAALRAAAQQHAEALREQAKYLAVVRAVSNRVADFLSPKEEA